MPVEASKQKQVILHVATDSELFGCRPSVELLVVSEVRCLEYISHSCQIFNRHSVDIRQTFGGYSTNIRRIFDRHSADICLT